MNFLLADIQGGEPMEIVIAEDEPKVQRGLSNIITSYSTDWKVTKMANNGLEAIEYIYEHDIDVLITDIRMPDIDGLELVSKIRELGKNNIEILILSGYENFNYARKAIELGVRRYLTKPTNPKEIISSLIEINRNLIIKSKTLINQRDNNTDDVLVNSNNLIIQKALEYIHLHYSEKILLVDIANILYINPKYLCEIFKKEVNKTVVEYIVEYRIKMAKKYLHDLRYKIYDVAVLVGYHDPKHFSQSFKKITNFTPAEYRNSNIGLKKG